MFSFKYINIEISQHNKKIIFIKCYINTTNNLK